MPAPQLAQPLTPPPAAQIDAAKFADLVLLLVDGNFGFEMETFEFLNVLQVRGRLYVSGCPAADACPPAATQVHGFPKVMGVLTHLDEFTDPSKLKKVKKTLKARQPTRALGSSTASRFLSAPPTAPLLDGDLQRRQALLHQRHGARAVQQARHAQPGALHLHRKGVCEMHAAQA